jgi:hypothetical protein
MTDRDDLVDSRGHRPACTDFSLEPMADPNSVYLDLFCGCHDWPVPRILSNATDVAWPAGWNDKMADEWRAKNDLTRP